MSSLYFNWLWLAEGHRAVNRHRKDLGRVKIDLHDWGRFLAVVAGVNASGCGSVALASLRAYPGAMNRMNIDNLCTYHGIARRCVSGNSRIRYEITQEGLEALEVFRSRCAEVWGVDYEARHRAQLAERKRRSRAKLSKPT